MFGKNLADPQDDESEIREKKRNYLMRPFSELYDVKDAENFVVT